MSRLCLSVALLFFVVVLVDSTPVSRNNTQDQGLETSHGQRSEKYLLKDVAKKILKGVNTGGKIIRALESAVPKKSHKKRHHKKSKAGGRTHGKHSEKDSGEESRETHNSGDESTETIEMADIAWPMVCLNPPYPGPCKNQEMRFYYDYQKKQCKPIASGRCGWVGNNFDSEMDCIKTCNNRQGSIENK